MEKMLDVAEARRILEKEVIPAVDRYHFPAAKALTREDAVRSIGQIREALSRYEATDDAAAADEAMRTIINVVGTQRSKRSLYGGAGGSSEKTNPDNPLGQRISSYSDRIRNMARRERERLRTVS